MMHPKVFAVRVLRKFAGKSGLRATLKLKKLKLQKIFYKKEISLADLRAAFLELGVEKGRTLWVQSSWNDLYNFKGKPTELIDLLLEMIGPEGTLVMPAIPIKIDPAKVLNIDSAPVSTGLICEIFRRYPGVRRSIHLTSSVIALGPNADFLVRDHHKTYSPWDQDSPYIRLMEVDALCLSIGLGPFLAYLTPLHAVETILRHEIQKFADVMSGTMTYRWKTKDGRSGEHTILVRNGTFNSIRLGKSYPKEKYKQKRISNINIWSISAVDAINIGVDLARKGITMYR